MNNIKQGAVHKVCHARGSVGGCQAQRYKALHGGGGVSGRSLRNAIFHDVACPR